MHYKISIVLFCLSKVCDVSKIRQHLKCMQDIQLQFLNQKITSPRIFQNLIVSLTSAITTIFPLMICMMKNIYRFASILI